MRNRNRQYGSVDQKKYKTVRWKIMYRALIILILAVEIMTLYRVSSLLTAGASPMSSALYGHERRSISRFTPGSQSICAIGRTHLCALNAIAATPTSTPIPTPTHIPRVLTGVINTPIVNGGNSNVSIKDRDQSISFNFETDVTDNRGSGVGWRLNESATALQFGADGPKSDLFLDTVKPIVVTCATNSTCSSTNLLVPAPLGQDLVTEPITLIDAPFLSGIGAFSITTLGYFVVPASARIGQTTGGLITVTIFGAP